MWLTTRDQRIVLGHVNNMTSNVAVIADAYCDKFPVRQLRAIPVKRSILIRCRRLPCQISLDRLGIRMDKQHAIFFGKLLFGTYSHEIKHRNLKC